MNPTEIEPEILHSDSLPIEGMQSSILSIKQIIGRIVFCIFRQFSPCNSL